MSSPMSKGIVALLLAILWSPLVSAQPDAESAYFSCRSCHGDKGEGSAAIHAPAIAGQFSGYLARQLRHYRDGVRGVHPDDRYGRQMALMAANLSDDAIDPLAKYVEGMPVEGRSDSSPADAPVPYRSCIVCHGEQGQGNKEMSSPRIAGLDNLYLETQLRNFRDGIRGRQAGDAYGAQMAAAVTTLNDEDITLISDYLAQLP
jgi:cytochrome c oxidase subunit 2